MRKAEVVVNLNSNRMETFEDHVNNRSKYNPQSIPCPVCEGKGERNDQKSGLLRVCVACKGSGAIQKKKS